MKHPVPKNDTIQHWVDKKVAKGLRRIFFRNDFQQPCEALITAKGLLGVQLYYAKVPLQKGLFHFYIEVPTAQYRLIQKYEVIVHKNQQPLWKAVIKPTGQYEDLLNPNNNRL